MQHNIQLLTLLNIFTICPLLDDVASCCAATSCFHTPINCCLQSTVDWCVSVSSRTTVTNERIKSVCMCVCGVQELQIEEDDAGSGDAQTGNRWDQNHFISLWSCDKCAVSLSLSMRIKHNSECAQSSSLNFLLLLRSGSRVVLVFPRSDPHLVQVWPWSGAEIKAVLLLQFGVLTSALSE